MGDQEGGAAIVGLIEEGVCFITAGPITNLFAWGGEESGGHVLRETTSRGRCGLVCPSRTSERGGQGDCVKEGGGGEGERAVMCRFIRALRMQSTQKGPSSLSGFRGGSNSTVHKNNASTLRSPSHSGEVLGIQVQLEE